jgi:hypothetical protein
MGEDKAKEAEAAEVQKALDQRDEEPTPEQENVASTDTVQVYRDVEAEGEAEAEGQEVWKYKRVAEDGSIVSESDETFTGDNFAIAHAAAEFPGLMVHAPDTVARELPEEDVQEIQEGAGADA